MQTTNHRSYRRGVVAVEFALVVPMFTVLVLGMIELGRGLEVSQVLSTAVREGARFAAMDEEDLLLPGQTRNEKTIQDIRNFITAAGFPGSAVTVAISDADSPGSPFDLSDPANALRLFRIDLSLAYNEVAVMPPTFLKDRNLSTHIVFQNGRTSLAGGN
jgi:hypothetical protein